MFGNKQKVTIRDLENENARLKRENESLKANLEEINSDSFNAPVALDFKAMNAFSIERMKDGSLPKTVVGYLVIAGEKRSVKEWYLYCSDQVHKDLVEKFNNYIASK